MALTETPAAALLAKCVIRGAVSQVSSLPPPSNTRAHTHTLHLRGDDLSSLGGAVYMSAGGNRPRLLRVEPRLLLRAPPGRAENWGAAAAGRGRVAPGWPFTLPPSGDWFE